MQIGSDTAWDTTRFTDPSVQGRGAGDAPTAAPADRATETSGKRRSEVLAEAAGSGKVDPSQRPPEEQLEIAELKRRDQEVRQHEAAHMAAGGGFVRGGATYSFQSGPDGKRYAVGGEVSIDTASVPNNPEATIAKMQAVRGAALAPANPSGQDISVAARATQKATQARMEAAKQAQEATREDAAEAPPSDVPSDAPAPSSPADTVGPAPVSPGSLLDAYA